MLCIEAEFQISGTDYICFNCYKSHIAIIKSLEGPDSSLNDLITIWQHKLTEENDRVTQCLLHTIIYVADEINNCRAVLLPYASKAFLEAYCESSDNENDVPILECTEGTVKFSSSWLLKQLLTHLHSHMEHKCVHRKFGIILFRKGGDLLTSLSWALGRAHTCSETTYTYTNNLSGNESDVTDALILCRAATIVNDVLHHESAELFLSHLFTLILRHSYMPKALRDCLLIPIPKPSKDPSLSDSYRPIALLHQI